jgi:hypothetical protein
MDYKNIPSRAGTHNQHKPHTKMNSFFLWGVDCGCSTRGGFKTGLLLLNDF